MTHSKQRAKDRQRRGYALIAFLFLLSARTFATVALYEIDPVATSLTLEASTSGVSWQEQAPGSLGTSGQGWLAVDLEAGSMQFIVGNTLILAQTNSCQPGTNGAVTNAPASFGGETTLGTGLSADRVVAALRNLSFDLSGPPIVIAAGQFDVAGLVFAMSGPANPTLDYRANGLLVRVGSRALAGLQATNASAVATLSLVAEVQTVTVPVDITLTCQTLSPDDTVLRFVGQVVARRGMTIVRPELLWVRSANNPENLTLVWSNPYKLQTSATLTPPNWVDYATDAPVTIVPQAPLGFFRVVAP